MSFGWRTAANPLRSEGGLPTLGTRTDEVETDRRCAGGSRELDRVGTAPGSAGRNYFHMNGDLSTRSAENGWTRHRGTNGRESVIDAAGTSAGTQADGHDAREEGS